MNRSRQPLSDCKKFSNWRQLIRVTAYKLRFIWRLRKHGRKGSAEGEEALKHEDGPLSPQELQDAETHWLKESQKTLKDSLRKGEFRNLSPYVNPEGVVRVGGRADKALGPLHMNPVDQAGSVSEISPRHSSLYKNFDVFI